MAAVINNPGDVPRPSGRASSLTVLPYWPSISETDLQALADDRRAMAESVSGYAGTVHKEMTNGASLLEGQGGEARIALMRKMVDHADGGADYFKSTATAADSFRAVVSGLKTDLSRVADAAAEAWDTAQSSGGTSAAVSAMAPFNAEAATLYSTALGDIAATPAVLPIPEAPVGESPSTAEPASHESANNDEKQLAEGTTEEPDGLAAGDNADEKPLAEELTNNDAAATNGQSTQDQKQVALPVSSVGNGTGLPMGGTSGGSAGGGLPSAGSAMGGLRPPQMPAGGLSNPLGSGGKSLSDAFTSPAAAADSLGSGGSLTSAASSFNSGLASGIGSSGAVSPPLEKFVAQHPGTAPGVAQPAGPVQPPVVASGGGPASAGAAPMVGGGGGMPMMAHPPAGGGAGGGPLAPFVPPGGGAAASPTGVGPTAPASAASAPAAAGPSGQQGGAAPVMAGSSGAATAASLPEPDVSADLMLARQVLDGLVRGTDASWNTIDSGFVNWAVAVVRTQFGPQLVIASSAGGGVYVPASVYIPTTARIAPRDPALPMRWADRYMGWRRPADVLSGHADALADRASGVVRSALVTTAEGPRPAGWQEFETVTLRSILHTPGSVPVLDGEHQHRLATIDPVLAQQISTVIGGASEVPVAAVITRAVVEAAIQEPAATKSDRSPVCGADGPYQVAEAADLALLNKLGQGTPVDWEAYNNEVAQRHEGNATSPHLSGPLDLEDDPKQSLTARMLYIAFYRTALIAELIRYWQQPASPSLADIVYCAKVAGFGQVVASTLSTLERQCR